MEGLDANLVKLRIIGSLGPQDRLKIYQDGTVALDRSRSAFNSLWRWWSGDSRLRTIQYVRSTLSEAVRHVSELSYQPEKAEERDLLCQELQLSLKGIDNLKKTYENDVQVVSCLDVIQKKVEHHIQKTGKHMY